MDTTSTIAIIMAVISLIAAFFKGIKKCVVSKKGLEIDRDCQHNSNQQISNNTIDQSIDQQPTNPTQLNNIQIRKDFMIYLTNIAKTPTKKIVLSSHKSAHNPTSSVGSNESDSIDISVNRQEDENDQKPNVTQFIVNKQK